MRLYAKLGFVLEGRDRESLWHDGRYWDSVDYGMVEGEWAALREEERKREEGVGNVI